MTTAIQKEALLMNIENSIAYREDKAAKYPDDKRNHESAEALRRLYQHIDAMDSQHQLFAALDLACEDDGASLDLTRTQSEMISRIGFDYPDAPDLFVEELIKLAGAAASDGAIVSGARHH